MRVERESCKLGYPVCHPSAKMLRASGFLEGACPRSMHCLAKEVTTGVLHAQVFTALLSKIYKRKK